MTITTRSTGSKTRRGLRSLGLTLAAASLATAATASLSTSPTVAQADPGDTFVAIGTSQLIQSEDLSSIQVPLDREAVTLNQDSDFSSCLGEGNSWTEVLKGADKPITAVWTSSRHKNQALYERIGQAKTPAQATRYANTLIKQAVKACQGDKSPWDFHYGRTTTDPVGSGTATYALSYRGSSTRPDGGVVVFSKGTNFGYIQVSGTFGPAAQTMESVAKVATSRLF